MATIYRGLTIGKLCALSMMCTLEEGRGVFEWTAASADMQFVTLSCY